MLGNTKRLYKSAFMDGEVRKKEHSGVASNEDRKANQCAGRRLENEPTKQKGELLFRVAY